MVNLKLHLFLFLIHIPSPIFSSDLCNSNQDPLYCKSLLSLQKSLSGSTKLLSKLDNLVPTLSGSEPTTLHGFQDCLELAESNVEFLTTSLEILNSTKQPLSASRAEEVHTLLSAVLTNHQTCLDGLQPSRRDKGGLSEVTELYNDALSSFVRHKHFRKSKKHVRTKFDDGYVVINDMVTVSKDGLGNFTTIGEAISSAPDYKKRVSCIAYYLIYIPAGVYEEYITVDKTKKCVMMIGDGINKTVITGNHSHAEFWSTFKSATFAAKASHFVAMNILFSNTAGPQNQMAVALRNDADMSAFYQCSFEAYQDTLYVHSLRQFYKDCDIYGTVDFIFGNAAAVFQNCRIIVRLPLHNINTVTAQSRRRPDQNTGIVIQNCTVEAGSDLRNGNKTVRTYLGRPWKEYSRTVFMECFIGDVVDRAGWYKWNGKDSVSELYYAEYGNVGPGSGTLDRVTWPGYHRIDAATAANFTVARFVGGGRWLPRTGVPFEDGLLRRNRSSARVST